MSDATVIPVPAHYLAAGTRNTADEYATRYAESIANPEAFWAKEAQVVDWMKPFTQVKDVSFKPDRKSVV